MNFPSQIPQRSAQLTPLLAGVLTSLFVLFFGMKSPEIPWDFVSYLGLTWEEKHETTESLHQAVFTEFRQHHDAREGFDAEVAKFAHLREAMVSDAESFRQQLDFFRPRILYVESLKFLENVAGLHPFRSGMMISLLASIAGIWLLIATFYRQLQGWPALFIPFVAIVSDFLFFAKVAGPDATSFFFQALCVFFFARKHYLFLALALPLCVCNRTDAVVFAGLLAGIWFLSSQGKRRILPFCCAVASVATYFAMNKIGAHYGWSLLFENTFVEYYTHPADAGIVSISLAKYLTYTTQGLVIAALNTAFQFYLIALLGFLVISSFRESEIWTGFPFRLSMQTQLVVLSLGQISAHFLLFPVAQNRFYMASYLVTIFATLALLKKLAQHRTEDTAVGDALTTSHNQSHASLPDLAKPKRKQGQEDNPIPSP